MIHLHRLPLDLYILLPLLILAGSSSVLSVEDTGSEGLYLGSWSRWDPSGAKMELVLNLKLSLRLRVDVGVPVQSIAWLHRLLLSNRAFSFIIACSSGYWASGVPLSDSLDSLKAALDSIYEVFTLLLQIKPFFQSGSAVFHVVVG